jgi:hypothetical protein
VLIQSISFYVQNVANVIHFDWAGCFDFGKLAVLFLITVLAGSHVFTFCFV